MQIRLTPSDDFFSIFPCAPTPYSSKAFTALNAPKAEAVRLFTGYDENGSPRIGAILGLRQGRWLCPFSAPFGELLCAKPQSIERFYEFVTELADTLKGMPIRFTLPPLFYGRERLTAQCGVLANLASKSYYDYNYHYDLSRAPQFELFIDRAARKNLRKARELNYRFELTNDIARAYEVIRLNREGRGYPLAMSFQQVADTIYTAVRANCFVLSLDGADVAAAIVFDVAPGIGQVIYWGDAPGHSESRPMNILPYFLFNHYARAGYKILDIGPSSSAGVPSAGLCRFKESLGCELSLKPTFEI